MSFQSEDEERRYKQLTAKAQCERSHLWFTRYHFRARTGIPFKVNWHHQVLADIVDDVITGKLRNVVINIPPGGTKTELVVIHFIARGLAINPRARFLHLSGSNDLATLNSATAREIVTSDEYQKLWPLKIADDAKAKKRWNVEIDGRPAGGVYATSLGGQVTGFRAGHMAPGFQGAIIIDDPIKPDDAFSVTKINAANTKLITTVQSRRATPATPIILIMQRVAENDPSGYILRGNFDKDWHHVTIPAVVDEKYLESLAPKYRALVQIPAEKVDDRFSYWPEKEPLDSLLKMERGEGVDQTGSRISKHVFNSQYQQSPRALGGNIIKGSDFNRYSVLPRIKHRSVYVDTAQKAKRRNDFSVFEEWGLSYDGRIYLLDMIRGRWEAPELLRRAVAFWAKAKARNAEMTGTLVTGYGQLRRMLVEDKVSGTGLIQTVKLPPYNIPVKDIQRNTDKYERVNDVLPYIEAGLVSVPLEAPFTLDFVTECEAFTADDSHDYDDQVDPMVDAINDMLATNKLKTWEQLGKNEQKTPT